MAEQMELTRKEVAQLDWHAPAGLARRWGLSEDTIVRRLFVPTSADDPTPDGMLRAMRFGRQYRIHVREADRFELAYLCDDDRAKRRNPSRPRRRGKGDGDGEPDYLGDL